MAPRFLTLSLLFGAIVPLHTYAQNQVQLNQNCTVSVLNRNVQVNADGTWVLPNIPANFGPVRFRATCVSGGVTQSGQSDLYTIPANGAVSVPPIPLGNTTPIPSALTVTAPTTSLTTAGQTVQLTVTATNPDGTMHDVTAASAGTVYRSSNPALATVSQDGLVTLVTLQSGALLVQAENEGSQGMLSMSVGGGGNGLPTNATELQQVLSWIEVKPSSFLLTVSSLSPQASQQLQVIGHLNDGTTTLDITSSQPWGTNYSSSDLTVCSFGAPDGNVGLDQQHQAGEAGMAPQVARTIALTGFEPTGIIVKRGTDLVWLAAIDARRITAMSPESRFNTKAYC